MLSVSNFLMHAASIIFFFTSRRRHTRYVGDWISDVCSSDLPTQRQLWACHEWLERDDHCWSDRADFALEPFMARRHLTLRWRLVNPALAARLPAEVLDGVGGRKSGGEGERRGA